MASRRRFPQRAGVATLLRRSTLTPRMIRVTLGCDEFGDEWPIEQPGEILTLLFVPPGEAIVLPLQGWLFPDGVEQEWRNYTVRRHDPAAREIDVDVVLHDPRGPACTWAERSEIGAGVGYAGPRVDFAPREDAEWLLLCGDETALPAIAAILETPLHHQRKLAVIEVADAAEEHPLDGEVRWVHRNGDPFGVPLAEAVRAVELPDGPGQAWGAAESTVARDLREVLRRAMPRKHVKATGYWLRSGDWLLDD